MEYLIQIYEGIDSISPLIQIETFYSLEIQEDLTSFSTGTIGVKKINGLEKNQIIKIIEISDNDIILFEGYIDDLSVGINEIQITFKELKAMFQNKKVLSDKTFTTQTPKQIIDNLISDYNAYGDTWSCISTITSTISKEYSIGDNYYDIINELCDFFQLQWTIKNGVIYIEEFIGVDRTGINFFEFIYNASDITENNITDITRKSSPIYNIIIGVDSDGNKSIKTDSTSIATYGPIATSITIRNGTLADITQAYLDFYKTAKYYYELESELLSENLNIGDKVVVRIEEAGEYFNFNGNAFIIAKKTQIINNTKIINYNISTNNVKLKNFIQRIRDIDSELNFFSFS